MTPSTSVTLSYSRPKWWQFTKRFNLWRSERRLIGMVVVFNGQERTITKYKDNTVTLDRPFGEGQ